MTSSKTDEWLKRVVRISGFHCQLSIHRVLGKEKFFLLMIIKNIYPEK